jgi:hypothetical protein
MGVAPAMAASQPTLFTLASGTPKVLAQGAQKSWPIKIGEDQAFDAVFQGGMWLPNPTGGRIYAKYQRHILHDNGTWTWIGTVSTVHGDQSVVLTFGKDGVFGLIPQASGYPLRIVTRAGDTSVVETSAAMSRSVQQLRLYSKPDAFVPPRVAPSHGAATTSPQAAASAPVQAAASGPVTIDVMVAYTSGFVSELGSQSAAITRIQNLVDSTNQAYTASGVNQQIRLVHTVEVDYPDNNSNQTALDDITGIDENGNPVTIPASLRGIASLRVQYGADLVSLIRGYDNAAQGSCGVGWLIGGDQTPIVPSQSKAYGYSVVSDGSSGGYYCMDTTFAHELGHNMGDAHDRANANEAGAYSYSYGYLGNGSKGFATIMAYGTGGIMPLSLFSNPDISSCQNTPCGVADDASNSADNVHSMNNTASKIAAFESSIGDVSLGMTASNDVNGDGKSDLLWLNDGTHQFGYWAMNGAKTSSRWSTTVSSGYRVVATGDFNGDGLLDVVWTSAKNDLYLWKSNGRSFASQYIGTYPSGNAVVGAGDVDGDGDADLLFLNTQAHTFGYWLMNGASVGSKWSTSVAAGYTVAAIGDLDGDGRIGVVWTSAKRDLYLWESNGSTFDAYYIGTYPAGWSLVGAGDVNGDGLADLLWRNQGASLFGYWIMRGPKQVSGWTTSAASAYYVAATGDFNGDGKVDVMWTSAGRDLYLWTSNGKTFSAVSAGTYPSGWSVIPSQVMAAWGHP